MAYTLTSLSRYEEDIRKSRFLALAQAVDSPEEAMAFFQQHAVPEATHNCWAYRIGQAYRFNDDGEPGGTAGRPILQAIEGQDCDRVAVLVIRWFGGTKLGAGGLVRAYGGVAAQCLRLAEKQLIVDEATIDCHCSFADMALLRARLGALDARIMSETFDEEGVSWEIVLPRARAEEFGVMFTNLTRGQSPWAIRGADAT